MAEIKLTKRIYNFSAGPAVLPTSVLEKAQEEMLNFKNSGMSVMEMSHRSKPFDEVLESAERGVRNNLGVPDNYAILFLQGGASQQFAMVPMNLCVSAKSVVDVIHTGIWTEKAMKEIKKIAKVHLAASGEPHHYTQLPDLNEIDLNETAAYVYMASNNTIMGTQWQTLPQSGKVPLVSDMSSDIFSRKINVSDFGIIFAGAQKNMGPSGVTLVIIRKDLADRVSETVPTIFQYRSHIKAGSRYNTPPTFGIYMVDLVMKWITSQGGVGGVEKYNEEKAQLLYDAIDATSFYKCPVRVGDRSRMNVVFRIKDGDESLEEKFLKEATANGLSGLKGHRSVGGLRASIYNAHRLEGVKALVDFMREFEKKNG